MKLVHVTVLCLKYYFLRQRLALVDSKYISNTWLPRVSWTGARTNKYTSGGVCPDRCVLVSVMTEEISLITTISLSCFCSIRKEVRFKGCVLHFVYIRSLFNICKSIHLTKTEFYTFNGLFYFSGFFSQFKMLKNFENTIF